jgi:hypothetical protein
MWRRTKLGPAAGIAQGQWKVLAALVLSLAPLSLSAQTPSQTRLPALKFFSFRVGIPVETIASTTAGRDGSPLDCRQSALDLDVLDCRSSLGDPITGTPVELWLSAMDSLVGVLTISGKVSGLQLDAWRSSLVSAYGEAPVVGQGGQRMLQWIRHRQMLRLTWRNIDGITHASVSLTDGPVLDGWARRRREAVENPSKQ